MPGKRLSVGLGGRERGDGWSRGFERLERPADGPDHTIPGHDPLILKRFPALGGDWEIVRVNLPPNE